MPPTMSELADHSKQAVSYMIDEITHICRDMEKRASGSDGERKAGEYMAGVLEKECGCRNVKTESFNLNSRVYFVTTPDPLAAMGWYSMQPTYPFAV